MCPRILLGCPGTQVSQDSGCRPGMALIPGYGTATDICCISCLVHSPHSRHLDTHGDPRLTLTHMDTLVLRFSVRAADRSASSACATTWAARETAATRYSSPRRRSLLSMGASRLWPERAGVSEGRSRSRDFGWGGGGEARRGRRFESWRVSAGCQAVRQECASRNAGQQGVQRLGFCAGAASGKALTWDGRRDLGRVRSGVVD